MQLVSDSIQGEPIELSLDASIETLGGDTSWFSRVVRINRLLKRTQAKHLLKVQHYSDQQTSFYAGEAGISLAAGIEGMLHQHEVLQDSMVVLPLDERIYWAHTQGDAVIDEGAPLVDRFKEIFATWQKDKRSVILLTGGGCADVDMESPTELPVDMDVEAIRLRPASMYLLRQGLVRLRDCVWFTVLLCTALVGSFSVSFIKANEPVIQVLPQVTEFIEPLFDPGPTHIQGNWYLGQTLHLFERLISLSGPESAPSITRIELGWDFENPVFKIQGEVDPMSNVILDSLEKVVGNQPTINGDSWQIEFSVMDRNVPEPEIFPSSVSRSVIDLLQQHFTGMTRPMGLDASDTWQFDWVLTEDEEPVPLLVDFVRVTEGLPFTLQRLSCEVRANHLSQCDLSLSFPVSRDLS